MSAFEVIQTQLKGGAQNGHAKRNTEHLKYLKKIQGKSFAEVLKEAKIKLK